MTARYAVLGTTDDQTDCDLCGRTGLKSTVALRDNLGTEPVVYFGSDCAAKAIGWTVADVEVAARTADRVAREAIDARNARARELESARWFAWLADQTGTTDVALAISQLGGFALARAAYRAAPVPSASSATQTLR